MKKYYVEIAPCNVKGEEAGNKRLGERSTTAAFLLNTLQSVEDKFPLISIWTNFEIWLHNFLRVTSYYNSRYTYPWVSL